jgi:exosome complex RNA-binding protein Rrp4
MSIPTTASIIVGTNGFVWYTPKATDQGEYIHLKSARTIRQWGTTEGLAELVNGPTKETKLDSASDVVLAKTAFLFAIPCKDWKP